MDDRTYSSLSRHSLASSYSYLDGVPFKIGPSFKQPPKVVAPPELSSTNVSQVLNEEYTFETEEAVLAWAQAREEALKRAAEERAEKLRQEAEQAQREAEQASAAAQQDTNGNEESSDNQNGHASTNQPDTNVYDVPRSTAAPHPSHLSQQPIRPPVPPKPPVGGVKIMSEPGTILKPTPIHSCATASGGQKLDGSSASNSRFDVSMFESEADPFDNLELQTLNDMEELKVVLDSSSKTTAGTASSQANVSQLQGVSAESSRATTEKSGDSGLTDGFYELATVVKENAWETFEDDTVPGSGTHFETNGALANGDDSLQSTTADSSATDETSASARAEGEYVELNSNFKKQVVSFQNHAINGVNRTPSPSDGTNSPTTVLGGKLPNSLANSKLYKPVLPPINKPPNDSGSQTNPFSINPAQTTNPFLQQTTQEQRNPFNQNTPETWNPSGQSSEPFSTKGSMLSDQSVQLQVGLSGGTTVTKPSPILPPPATSRPTPMPRTRQPVNSARMWSSVEPSLAASLDESSTASESIPSNPYSRHSLSSSDLHSQNIESDGSDVSRKSPVPRGNSPLQNSSQQPWNRHRPLPPPPSSNPTPESYKASQLPPSKPVGLTDPYHSLSREAQAFTDSLTSMGFLRARVARAVAKFGQDEKEVLDHLIAVDKLAEKKYAPVLVESALHTYKNDAEKAEKFIEMVTQFEELGFKSDKIQQALVSTNLDHDQALDMLTA